MTMTTTSDRIQTGASRPVALALQARMQRAGTRAERDTGQPPLAQRLDTVLQRWVQSRRIVGVTVLVLRAGEPIYRRAAGFADLEARRPATHDTLYRLASMTKAITSAAALALVDAGTLTLDDPIARWLPGFRPALADGRRPDITVQQLLTHTSGLSYAFFEPPGSPYHRHAIPSGLHHDHETLDQAIRRMASVPLVYPPGTQWRYSVSTDVLGAVMARAAGMPLPRVVARYVTGPLGMTDTAFVVTDPARLAAPYRDGETAARRMGEDGDTAPMGEAGVPFSPSRASDPTAWPSGGGGMSGTAADYARFLEAIRRGGSPILSPVSAALFTQHQIGELRAWTEGEGWGHGLGAAVLVDPQAAGTPQNAGTWQWGGVLGVHWFVDPVEELTVVVLTNTSVAGVIGDFPADVRNAIYGAASAGSSAGLSSHDLVGAADGHAAAAAG